MIAWLPSSGKVENRSSADAVGLAVALLGKMKTRGFDAMASHKKKGVSFLPMWWDVRRHAKLKMDTILSWCWWDYLGRYRPPPLADLSSQVEPLHVTGTEWCSPLQRLLQGGPAERRQFCGAVQTRVAGSLWLRTMHADNQSFLGSPPRILHSTASEPLR